MNFNDMQALSFEIKNLHDKIEIYSKNNEYVYTNVYKSWTKTSHIKNRLRTLKIQYFS